MSAVDIWMCHMMVQLEIFAIFAHVTVATLVVMSSPDGLRHNVHGTAAPLVIMPKSTITAYFQLFCSV